MGQQPQIQKPKNKPSKSFIVVIILIIIAILGWAGITKAGYLPNFLGIDILHPFSTNTNYNSSGAVLGGKPVIYLYPQQKQNVKVELNFQGKMIADYPQYDSALNGWNVTAFPDGHLINQVDGQEYSYIFWEGIFGKSIGWDLSKGFIVKGEDTREFLQNTLSKIGLTPREYNEFIVWWYPKMKDNKYNLIHFAGEEYTNAAPLTITPKPNSMLRVFMVFKPLEESTNIEPQAIQPFERKGFTAVEWGGAEIN